MSKIMIDEATVKLALEALEWNMDYLPSQGYGTSMARKAITALREALAEQPAQQEPIKPFAWANTDDLCADTAFRWCEIGDHKTPVYTSPPAQRKPLTDEEIGAMWVTARRNSPVPHVVFARAIEAKLKEKNT